MHMIVVGCGRVGSTVARDLDEAGHDVVVVDRREAAFARLGPGFGGRTVVGVGFDREVLREAGIDPDGAVMAVTSGDNSNILIARVAREMFGVQRVVARIYDPRRAAVYERLGIPTVATVAWTGSRIIRLVLGGRGEVEWTDPTATHVLVERRVPPAAAGVGPADVGALGARVVLVVRDGAARLPGDGLLLQEGDTVHLLGPVDAITAVDGLLTRSIGGVR
jgi:trk system potassium uptake protein TrkA